LKSNIGCWVGVVDEGINPMDLEEVIRAIRTRSNPEKDLAENIFLPRDH
jgi:UbiD family decarboxylase